MWYSLSRLWALWFLPVLLCKLMCVKCEWTALFKSIHKFSVELTSGLWCDQLTTLTLFWNTVAGKQISSQTTALSDIIRFSSRISLYFVAFIYIHKPFKTHCWEASSQHEAATIMLHGEDSLFLKLEIASYCLYCFIFINLFCGIILSSWCSFWPGHVNPVFTLDLASVISFAVSHLCHLKFFVHLHYINCICRFVFILT